MDNINWSKLVEDLTGEGNLKQLPPTGNYMGIPEFAISAHIDNMIATYGLEVTLDCLKIKLETMK